jgi:transcriptional regulator with XRE-family HTH domain
MEQKELASAMECDVSFISLMERGRRSISVESIQSLCNAVGFEIRYFFDTDSGFADACGELILKRMRIIDKE